MRPDKSGVIMLAANFFWRGLPVDVLVPAGEAPKKKALDWLMKFSAEKKRLLIYQVKQDWFASALRPFSPKYPRVSRAARSLGKVDPRADWQLLSNCNQELHGAPRLIPPHCANARALAS